MLKMFKLIVSIKKEQKCEEGLLKMCKGIVSLAKGAEMGGGIAKNV